MNGLALCAGVGGIDLGLKLADVGYRTVCFCERDAFAASVLVARMEDETLDRAPIWDDLTTFDGRPWRGVVDLVAAGLPCQPYSVAGDQRGHDDERALWPHFVRIVREVEPSIVFLENVPPFLKHAEPIFDALRAMGFEWAPPCLSTAANEGAPHDRARIFLLATQPSRVRWAERRAEHARVEGRPDAPGVGLRVADSQRADLRDEPRGGGRENRGASPVARNAFQRSDSPRVGRQPRDREGHDRPARAETPHGHGHGHGRESERCGWLFDVERQTLRHDPDGCVAGCRVLGTQWASESPVVRVGDGATHRVDRLRAIGNGVVPIVVANAFRELIRHAHGSQAIVGCPR